MNCAGQTNHLEKIRKACDLYLLALARDSKYRERMMRQAIARIQGSLRRARVAHARGEV